MTERFDCAHREATPAAQPLGRNRSFLLLWAGRTVSLTGDRLHLIAIIWWLQQGFGSTALMGLVMICFTLPPLVLGPLAGTYVDRWSRRRIVIGADLVRGVIVLLLAGLAWTGALQVWQLALLTLLHASASAFFNPAVAATIPNLVGPDQLTRANSLTQISETGSGVAGPALGGLIIALWGVPVAFLVNGLSFLLSGLWAVGISFPRRPALTEPSRPLAELREAMAFVNSRRVLLGLCLVAAMLNFFAAPVIILLPRLVQRLGQNAAGFGLLDAAVTVGLGASALALAALPEVRRRYLPIIWGTVLVGLAVVALGMAPHFAAALVVCLFLGAGIGLGSIAEMAALQAIVPDEKRGRVFALLETVSTALRPLSFGIVGLAAQDLPLAPVLAICGLAIAAGGLSLYQVRGIREI